MLYGISAETSVPFLREFLVGLAYQETITGNFDLFNHALLKRPYYYTFYAG